MKFVFKFQIVSNQSENDKGYFDFGAASLLPVSEHCLDVLLNFVHSQIYEFLRQLKVLLHGVEVILEVIPHVFHSYHVFFCFSHGSALVVSPILALAELAAPELEHVGVYMVRPNYSTCALKHLA